MASLSAVPLATMARAGAPRWRDADEWRVRPREEVLVPRRALTCVDLGICCLRVCIEEYIRDSQFMFGRRLDEGAHRTLRTCATLGAEAAMCAAHSCVTRVG